MNVPKVTVLGVGNIVLRDEGFGVRVMEALRSVVKVKDGVQFLDGGTLGMELIPFVEGTEKLLILDALLADGKGKIYRFSGAEIEQHFAEKLSSHEIGISDFFMMMKLTGRKIPEIVIIGAEPYDLEAGLELSPLMKELLPEAVAMAEKELYRWGVIGS